MTLVILYAGASDRNYDTMRTDERTTVSGLRLFEDVWCALRIPPARRRDQLLKFAMVGEISRLHSSRVNERYRLTTSTIGAELRRAPLEEHHYLSALTEECIVSVRNGRLLDLRNLRPRVSSRYRVLHWFRADGTQIPLQRQASPKAAIAEYLRPCIHKLFAHERSWNQSQRCRDVPVYHGESTLGISN